MCINIIVENDDRKFIPVEMMTEEMESELQQEYPKLPVARLNEGENTVMCRHVLIKIVSQLYKLLY